MAGIRCARPTAEAVHAVSRSPLGGEQAGHHRGLQISDRVLQLRALPRRPNQSVTRRDIAAAHVDIAGVSLAAKRCDVTGGERVDGHLLASLAKSGTSAAIAVSGERRLVARNLANNSQADATVAWRARPRFDCSCVLRNLGSKAA